MIDAHLNRRLAEGVRSWSKSGHLQRMTESGVFAWCREVALASEETGDAERFVQLLQSQGDYQTLRRRGLDDELLGVDRFAAVARRRLGVERRPWQFVYRAGSASPLNVTRLEELRGRAGRLTRPSPYSSGGGGLAAASLLPPNRADNQAGRLEQIDTIAFFEWVDATAAGDTARAMFLRDRFHDEMQPAFAAWVDMDPLVTPMPRAPRSSSPSIGWPKRTRRPRSS